MPWLISSAKRKVACIVFVGYIFGGGLVFRLSEVRLSGGLKSLANAVDKGLR